MLSSETIPNSSHSNYIYSESPLLTTIPWPVIMHSLDLSIEIVH